MALLDEWSLDAITVFFLIGGSSKHSLAVFVTYRDHGLLVATNRR
ncbi:hypothetical protein [Rhodococcus jostii]